MTNHNEKTATDKSVQALPVVDFLEKLGPKTQWLVLALLMIMSFMVFSDFLLLNNLFFYKDIGSDSLNLSYALLSHNIRYFDQHGFPSWSFEFGMGQNAYSFALYDPFDYLLYPLGLETAQKAIGFKVAIELILSGFVFYHYLRCLKLQQLPCILGALGYAFSGFMIVSSGWFIFSVEVLTMSFLLLGFEKLYQNNQYWILPLPIIYITISRPFVLATLTVFLLIYITVRLLQDDTFSPKKYFLTLGKTALAGLTGVLLAAPFLLEHLQVMLDSPRGSGANSLSATLKATPMLKLGDMLQIGTAMCRTFCSEILGSGNDFKGWLNILEAPAFYCGIPLLVFIPQLIALSDQRRKWIYSLFLLIWIIPVFFPYFRYAFSFFTGDYYRSYSFYVSLSFILAGVWGLQEILKQQKISRTALLVGLGIFLLMLLFPWFEEDIKIESLMGMVVFALVIYTGLLFLLPRNRSAISLGFLVLMIVELIYFSSQSVNNRTTLSLEETQQRTGYNDYTLDAIQFIRKSDTGFYRIDKRYFSSPAMHGGLNDGMVQGFYGTTAYNSFNQRYYIQYLKACKVIDPQNELDTRWAPGLASRMMLEGLNSVKYVLTKTPLDMASRMMFDSLGRFGDVIVLRHKYALPVGYAHSQMMLLSDFKKLSATAQDFMSYRAAIVADSNLNMAKDIPLLQLADTLLPAEYSFVKLAALTDTLRQHVFQLTSFQQTSIQGQITVPQKSIIYFSIPYDKNWKITEGATQLSPILLSDGMTGLIIEPGRHQLQFTFQQTQANLGKKISLAGVALMALLVFISFKYRKHAE